MRARLRGFVPAVLAVELLDELFDGAKGAALPLIRDDLGLGYAELGLLASLPAVLGSIGEVPIGLVATGARRRRVVLLGGVAFALSLVLAGLAPTFPVLLLAITAFFPSSGAFVSGSQVAMVAADPAGSERNLARWAVAGSIGATTSPFAIAAAGGWRPAFVAIGLAALVAARLVARHGAALGEGEAVPVGAGLGRAWRALGDGTVRRAFAVREVSDLLLDVLTGFAAVYLVDVGGASPAVAAVAIGIRQVVGLAAEVVLVRVLAVHDGTALLAPSAIAALAGYVAFLVVPGTGAKIIALAAVTLATSCWYPVLEARAYRTLGDDPNLALPLGAVSGVVGGVLPGVVGAAAETAGLPAAMWLLAAAPVVVGVAGGRGRRP